jgi:hypothetical protein
VSFLSAKGVVMAKVSDFLDALADSKELQVRYDKCTDEPMDEFGLDEDQKNLIRYGTPQEVRDYIANEELLEDAVYILRMLPPA